MSSWDGHSLQGQDWKVKRKRYARKIQRKAVDHESISIHGSGCYGRKVSDFHQIAINGAKFTQRNENAANAR